MAQRGVNNPVLQKGFEDFGSAIFGTDALSKTGLQRQRLQQEQRWKEQQLQLRQQQFDAQQQFRERQLKIQEDAATARANAATQAAKARADAQEARQQAAAQAAYDRQVAIARQHDAELRARQDQELQTWKASNPGAPPELPPAPVQPQLDPSDPYKLYGNNEKGISGQLIQSIEQHLGTPPDPDPEDGIPPQWGTRKGETPLPPLPPDYISKATRRVQDYLKAGHTLGEAADMTNAELLGSNPRYQPPTPAQPASGGSWLPWSWGEGAHPAIPEAPGAIQPGELAPAPDLSDAIQQGPNARNTAAMTKYQQDLEAFKAAQAAKQNYRPPVPPANLTAPIPETPLPPPPPGVQAPMFVQPQQQGMAPPDLGPPPPPASAPGQPVMEVPPPANDDTQPSIWKKTKSGISYSD